MDEYIVVHMPTGETVKGGFLTEEAAFQWLETNINELSPDDMDEYAIEKVEDDDNGREKEGSF